MTGWNESPLLGNKNLRPLRKLGVRTPSQALTINTMFENLTRSSSSGYFLVAPDGKYTLGNFPDYLVDCYGMSREEARVVSSYLYLLHLQKVPASLVCSLINHRDELRKIKFSDKKIKERLMKRYNLHKLEPRKREVIFHILNLS